MATWGIQQKTKRQCDKELVLLPYIVYIYIYIYIYKLLEKKTTNKLTLQSELLTKQACRDELVVYSLFFSPTTYTSLYLYVLSTFLRISNFTLIYIYIYIYSPNKACINLSWVSYYHVQKQLAGATQPMQEDVPAAVGILEALVISRNPK